MSVLAGALVGAAACSDEASKPPLLSATSGKVADAVMPSGLAGLTPSPEDVTKPLQDAGDKAFVTDVKLWSLRAGDRLRATIQVARFAPDAPYTSVDFQRSVAGQVGSSTPRARRVGDDVVYVSPGNQQVYYAWFRGPHFVLLSVPVQTANGRAILRAALREIQP